MKKTFLPLFASLVLGVACGHESSAILDVRIGGRSVVLSHEDAQRVIGLIEGVVRSANFNSRDHAKLLGQSPPSGRMPAGGVGGGSYLRASYPVVKEFVTVGGVILAKDVWVEIKDRNPHGGLYPGPITLISDGSPVFLTKESGDLVIGLGLDPALHPLLPEQMKRTLEVARVLQEEWLRSVPPVRPPAASPVK